MNLFKLLKLPVILLLSGLVTACGFHLRGEYSVPDELHTISLTSYDDFSDLTRKVKSQLELNKVQLVLPASSVINLQLLGGDVTERTLSLYQNSRVAEKELNYKVSYRVTIPNIGMRNFSVSVNRNYLDNPLTALAKSVEQEVIENEMRQEAASQIMRQLGRLRTEYPDHDFSSLGDIKPQTPVATKPKAKKSIAKKTTTTKAIATKQAKTADSK